MADNENGSANTNAEPETTTTNTQPTTVEHITVEDQADAEIEQDSKYTKFVKTVTAIGKYIKVPIDALFKCTGFFIFVYLVAWILNAIYSNIHFDLGAIRDFYLMVVGKNLGEHGINSLLNSDRGAMPTNRGK